MKKTGKFQYFCVMNNYYQQFQSYRRRLADVNFSIAMLQWDQDVYMPSKGAGLRAQQLSTLSGIAHKMATDSDYGKLLEDINRENTLDARAAKNVAEALKDYRKQLKYPVSFVETLSRTVSEAINAWQQAKKQSNFATFAPFLAKLVELKREECDMVGYKDHPYDALLDEFEPGAKTADLTALFSEVRKQLVNFVKQIMEQPPNDNSFMYKHYPKNKQWDFGLDLLKQMGYDFDAGRQDISAHPFTTSFHTQDVRVTTRINENDLNEMIWSCIHEGGHALYEQGLSSNDYGLATGSYVSLGIHESQSRLWENNVGRGLPYWKANYPKLQSLFSENLSGVTAEQFYKAMNTVRPSLVRTSADELTYHFHVMIRFEIEKALFEKKVEIAGIPEMWNSQYKEYLDLDVPDDARGVLQDIHWSYGSFGYFPTYSLGSFYAVQFYAKAKKDIVGLEEQISEGNLYPLLTWLRENIHRHGKLYAANELCENVTGEKLNFRFFMEYAKKKYSELY